MRATPRRAARCPPRLRIPALKWLLAASLLWPAATRAAELDKLPEAATAEAKALAVVFDFDTDSCYPSPAVSIKGEMNGGLKPTGSLTGECRGEAQLDTPTPTTARRRSRRAASSTPSTCTPCISRRT